MNPQPLAELAAWVLGALDPDRALQIQDAVGRSPRMARRVAAMQRRISRQLHIDERREVRRARGRPPLWRLPLPGVRLAGAPRVRVRPALVLGELRPGGRFEVLVAEIEAPEARRLVVLVRTPQSWEVVFPAEPDDDVTLAELPVREGGRGVGLVAGPEPGLQRWALAFPALEVPIDWAAAAETRWAALREALATGTLPAVVVEIVVRDRPGPVR